jgi:hypothetical protein
MCTRDVTYQNPNATQRSTIVTTRNSSRNIVSSCRLYQGFYPNFAPTINSLSVDTSPEGVNSHVYINGSNFLPPCYGKTYVNFGPYTNLPIIFYSSFNLSFVVPLNAKVGNYNIVVVNIYNSNFSPAVNQSYSGNNNYSNKAVYKIIK